MRPSLAAARRAEILRAIEACIREVGVTGLTTQRIADRSGYSRGHIRHYLGNKSDQLRALVDVYSDRYASTLEQLVAAEPREQRREVVIGELFGETWLSANSDDDVVLDHINAYALSNPEAGISLAPMYERVVAVVADSLGSVLEAEASVARARVVVAFAFGVASMMSLGLIRADDALEYARSLMELPPAP